MKRDVYLVRQEHFCASHRLHSPDLSDEENKLFYGKCNNKNGHGHNYILEITLKGEVDPKTGIIVNLTEVKDILLKKIIDKVDHKHLNHDIPELLNIIPSIENLVIIFWEWIEPEFGSLLFEVKLIESENNSAFYRG